MREWDYADLSRKIDAKKKKTELTLLSYKSQERPVRRRARDGEEQKILNALCLKRWQEAENLGQIQYISKNEWYYEY